MDEATTLSSGPPVRRGDPVAIDEAIRLSSGPLAGCVLAPATDAAMRLSSGTALGREPTDAATPLSSGPPSERTLGCDAEVLLALSAVPSELPAELVLGENTVKTRVAHLLSKLDLRDRVQAVVVAYETGLVAPELSPADGDLEA